MGAVARLGSVAVAVATAIVLTAVTILPFLTPAWVSFEQGRAEAAAWTGYSPTELRTVTDAILADLVIGPPTFDVAVGGVPVLTPPEQAHMRDVRGVFAGFYELAGVAVIILIAARFAGRAGGDPAGWSGSRFWIAVRRGAIGLAAGVAVAGVVALVAFDAAFEAFHRLFFPAGSYDFDPRIYRLTQLFPDAFWSETTTVLGAVLLAAALVLAWFAGRRAHAGDPARAAQLGTVAG